MENVLSLDQPHFMLKEIYQQPEVVKTCLDTYLVQERKPEIADLHAKLLRHSLIDLNLPASFYNVDQIHILACGTSRHAGLIAQYWLEQLAAIPTRVRSASEFQEAPWPLTPNTLTLAVTQSGETADTLTALRLEKDRRHKLGFTEQSHWLGITNQPESTLTQEVTHTLLTLAGPEIGVAATKTFTAQLVIFLCLALDLAARRQAISEESLHHFLINLQQVPTLMQQVLEQERTVQDLAQRLAATEHCILLGRGVNRAVALEGALKLKETTYLHAEGYAGGEFSHGPIALLDSNVPVIAIVPNGSTSDATLATVEKAKAHGSLAIGVVTRDIAATAASLFNHAIILPVIDQRLSPLLTVIPLQLLAYHIAVQRGLDVDRPRNITKTLA